MTTYAHSCRHTYITLVDDLSPSCLHSFWRTLVYSSYAFVYILIVRMGWVGCIIRYYATSTSTSITRSTLDSTPLINQCIEQPTIIMLLPTLHTKDPVCVEYSIVQVSNSEASMVIRKCRSGIRIRVPNPITFFTIFKN